MRIKEKFNPDKVFFTSDMHLFHTASITFCSRPFYSGNSNEMNEALISNWNETVPVDGVVFDLGDMMFTGNMELIRDVRDRLNGKIYRCLGNHDYQNRHDRLPIIEMFDKNVYDTISVNIDGIDLFMSHYPHFAWPRGAYHLHGHIHSGPNSTSSEIPPFDRFRYDVGVDNNDYRPISFRELICKFNKMLEDEIDKTK